MSSRRRTETPPPSAGKGGGEVETDKQKATRLNAEYLKLLARYGVTPKPGVALPPALEKAKVAADKAAETVKAAESANEKLGLKQNLCLLLAGIVLVCASVYGLKLWIGDRRMAHRNADGSPVWAFGDTGASCYQTGKFMANIVTLPVYYSGMIVYHILFVFIWIKCAYISVLTWLMTPVSYIFGLIYRIIAFCVSPILALTYRIISPFLGVIHWVLGIPKNMISFLRLDRVLAGLIALIVGACGFLEKSHKFSVMLSVMFFGISLGIWYNHGMDVLTWILMHFFVCPGQLATGVVSDVTKSLGYWAAVLSFTKMS